MDIIKIMLVATALIAFHAAASTEEQQTDGKVYECGGEKMELTQLENGNLALEGKGLTGLVSIHKPTGMYRGSVDGWGSQHETPLEALAAACRWLLEKDETQSEEILKKRLREFYDEWK